MERHNFRIISVESTKTMRKLCLTTKLPHQEIRSNYDILCSIDNSNERYIFNQDTLTSLSEAPKQLISFDKSLKTM